MRVGLIASLVCLFLVGLANADPAHASIRKTTNIPAEELGSALQTVAKDYDFQVLYRTEIVKDLRTQGAVGSLTSDEALGKVLKGTGLTYKYLDSNTVTIMPAAAGATAGPADQAPSDSSNGGGKKSSQDFRVAQVDQGKGTQSAAVGNQTNSQPNPSGQSAGLSEIIVTAQKRSENLMNVPISVSVLTGKELDRSTAQGVTEALNAVPGVATQQNYNGGGTIVVIRGVAPGYPTVSGSSPVAYYLDSVPFGLVKSAVGPDANGYDLQRVEVLRGPQGTLYGANALNGVVRVLTNDADLNDFEIKGRVSDSYTEYGGDNYRGDFAANVPLIADKLAIRAVAGYENNSGWIDQPDKNNVNTAEIKTFRLKLNAQPVQDLSIGLSAWTSRENDGASSLGYTFDKNASLLPQPVSTDYDAYGAKIGYQFAGISVSSATSYLTYVNDGNLGLDVPYFNIPGSTYYANVDSHVFSEEINLNSTLEGQWRWSAGGMYRRASQNTFDGYTVLGFSQYGSDISKSYAAYGELTRLFFQGQLELTAGLRHFHDDVSQEEQLSTGLPFIPAESVAEANTPRGVLTWHATEQVMAYASYSEGFRSGFPQDALVPPAAGIPAVKPDRLRNYELGSKGNFMDGRVAYDASVYYMDWRGIQETIEVPSLLLGCCLAVVNSQSASGIGTDMGLSTQPIENLTVRANVSWNHLEMDRDVISNGSILFHRGDRPTSSPETTGGLAVDYLFALPAAGYKGKFGVSANYTSVQSYRSVPGPGLPVLIQDGDPMVFARAFFSINSPDHWSATFYGDNLNNERGSPVKVFAAVPNWDARVRPRTFGIQLEYHQ